MMAPKYMRATQFHAVVQAAVYELDEPIDWVEIRGSMAKVSGGGRTIFVKCRLEHSSDGEGRPILGSDSWETEIVSAPSAAMSFALVGWLKGAFLLLRPRRTA